MHLSIALLNASERKTEEFCLVRAMWLIRSWCSGQMSGLSLGGGRAEVRTLAQIISISQSSPREVHRNAKTQLHSTTSKLQCWTPHAKQLARQEHNPPISREAA